MNEQSRPLERCLKALADRRRRFCLYHLFLATEPLPVRELGGAVEASLAPPEATITDWLLDEAVLRLEHTQLPALRDAGLVRVTDGVVELAPNPPFPIRDWLAVFAAIELDGAARESGRRGTGDRSDEGSARFGSELEPPAPRLGLAQR